MKNIISHLCKTSIAAGMLLGTAGTAHAAATLTFMGGTGNLSAGQTDYANFDTTFGDITGTTGTAGTYTGTTSGVAAEPAFGDQGDAYYYVSGGGSATFSFGAGVYSFGFDLGSADEYNTLHIDFAGGGSQDFIGSQLNPPGPANGDQEIMVTNGRVTIFGNGDRITGATFLSGQPSFEFDNIGTNAVPEPATWALFIVGFGVIGSTLRRRSAKFGAVRAAMA